MPTSARLSRICPVCSAAFRVEPNQLRRGAGIYCSRPCKNVGGRRPLADRLWDKVDRSGGPDVCWPYTTITKDTYGLIYYLKDDGSRDFISSHRAAWFVTHGVLPQAWVLHRCNNKRCCNPAHLYLGTHQDNMLDAKMAGVMPHGNVHHKAKITDDIARAIRELYGSMSQRQLAQMFSVSQANISDILHGNIWKDAGGPLKTSLAKTQTHCHQGHRLVDDNIVMSHGGRNRNCRICYAATQHRRARTS